MAIPKTMRGVQLIGHGGPEMLNWNKAIPVPIPGPDEALMRVLAAGVNNTDINTRVGWYSKSVTGSTDSTDDSLDVADGGWGGALAFPRIQGADMCGEIVSLGEAVTDFSVGQRVVCATCQPIENTDQPMTTTVIGSEYDGAFAQYCVVPADQLFDVSASPLTDIEIGAMPCAFGTAMGLLMRTSVTAGDRVLITGASGGVGMAAVMLARQIGANVTGICAASKSADVRAAGAVNTIDRGELPNAKEYSVVIDLVGGADWGALIDALQPGGRYGVAGAIGGPIVEADLRAIYLNDLTLFGCTYQSREVFAELVDLINKGEIHPLVSKTYPLRDIATAQADFVAKRYPGKLVLIP
jgi:NADPH:quinone reductase-like Zn-dependent oxidoreductase